MVTSTANKLAILGFILLLPIAVYFHLRSVPETPIEDYIEEKAEEIFFGGTLANQVAVDTSVEAANTSTEISSPGIVWTSDTNGYIFYEDSGGGLSMSSTTDSGATWSAARNVDSVNTADVISYGVWWEGWTPGTTTTRYIHIVTTDLGVDDSYYTRLDTQTGSFSASALGTTQGASCLEGADCYASITMTATGTLVMAVGDGSDSWVVNCGQYLNCTTAANWTERTGSAMGASNWGPMLLPIPGTNNYMNLFPLSPGSASNINYQIYSATTSSWWAVQTVDINNDTNTTYDSQMWGSALSTTTGQIFFTIADDANDYITADHDIKFYSFSTTTWSWTAKTNCTTNYTGGVTGAKVAYDETNDTLYCIMGLRTTIGTNTTGGIYYKTSTDGGTTWSATSSRVNDNADDINGMTVNIIGLERIGVTWNYTTAPRADAQYYDDIADLVADGGGGGGSVTTPQSNVIWLD